MEDNNKKNHFHGANIKKLVKKTIRKIFIKNIWWKILAIVSSVFLWIAAVDVMDPVSVPRFNRTIEVRGFSHILQNNLVILNETILRSSVIPINVSSRSSNPITQDLVIPFIDFSQIENLDSISTPTFLEIPVQVEISSITPISGYVLSPETTHLIAHIDVLGSWQLPIDIVIQNQPEGNYSYGEIVSNHSYIEFTGPFSIAGDITQAVAFVNLEGVTGPLIAVAKDILLLNENGEEVTHPLINRSIESVYLDIPIASIGTVPIVEPNIVGAENVALGTVFNGSFVNMLTANIFGDADVVASVSNIVLPDIDISGRSQSFTQNFDLQSLLPPDLTIRGNRTATATIYIIPIAVEPAQVIDLQILTDNIEIIGQVQEQYNITLQDYITITIQDTGINPNLVTATIYLDENLGTGVHLIPVETNISQDLLVEPVYAIVTVTYQQPIEEIEETEIYYQIENNNETDEITINDNVNNEQESNEQEEAINND